MKKQLLLISFIFSFLHYSFAQNPLVKEWDKRFGGTRFDYLNALQQTNDGGYMLVGNTESDSGGDRSQPLWAYIDGWIVKTDAAGNKQWDKRFGGNDWDAFQSLHQTADGGYLLAGFSASDISGDKTQPNWDPNDTTPDYWIVKIDSVGTKQWDKRFGGTSEDLLHAMKQTNDGGYILGGWSLSGMNGDKTQPNWDNTESTCDYWIVKVDATGNMQWNKRYGGTANDQLFSLDTTSDGGYILAGASSSGIGGDKSQPLFGPTGDQDLWIVKIDSLGTKQWDRRFGGTSIEMLPCIQTASDGKYILGAVSNSGISGNKSQPLCSAFLPDIWLVKINTNGNKLWDKDFGGADSDDEFGSISQTSDGGYLLGGTSYSTITCDKTENNLGHEQTWVIKTDSAGNKEWDKTLHTDLGQLDDEMGLAYETSDGCYIMANSTRADIGGDKTQPNWDTTAVYHSADFWIIKFCDSILTTSITQLPNTQLPFTIYPNPAGKELRIKNAGLRIKEIVIADLFGRTVLKSPIYNLQSSINISTLSPGIYFLKAGNEVRKFVKE